MDRSVSRHATTPRRGAEIRSDIQGLRALSLGVIIVFHLWPGALSGGYVAVDVFFVISGFLITTHLLLSAPATGRDLAKFWMRRIRRLLPAALLVLTVTLVATRLLAPDTRWREAGHEAIASALYFQNWHLADKSVDYLAEDNAPTAFQHYWTLSTEEQFYALWPLLVLACVLLARRTGARLAVVAAGGMGAVVAASLLFSIVYSRADEARAYFITPARMWEFALGGLTAALIVLAAERMTAVRALPAAARSGMVWAGFAGIVAPMFIFTSNTDFPGWVALFPAGGTALVIAAARPDGLNPNRLLAARPVQYFGDVSYSVYLWHWPLIVLVPYATSRPLHPVEQVAVVVAAIALGSLTKHQVEDRFRYHRPRVSIFVPYRFAAVGMAAVVGLAFLQVAEVKRRTAADRTTIEQIAAMQQASTAASPLACFGAAVLQQGADCPEPEPGAVVPSPALAANDVPATYKYDQCRSTPPFEKFRSCVFGSADAKTKIALVGNSHAGHWLPALKKLATERDFSITTYVSDHCMATDAKIEFETPEATRNCHAWGEYVLKQTTGKNVDLVVTSARTQKDPVADGDPDAVHEKGYTRYLRRLLEADQRVLVIRNTPLPSVKGVRPPECIAEQGPQAEQCAGTRDSWLRPDPLAAAARNVAKSAKGGDAERTQVADLTEYFCPEQACPPIIGGAMVYSDPSHITATYARSLAPALEPHLLKAMDRKAKSAPPAGAPISCVGAGALAHADRCPPGTDGPFVPSTTAAPEDYVGNGYAEGCWTDEPFEQFRSCRYGPQDAKTHVAVVGNSHAAQWLPALNKLATEHGFRITLFAAMKCFPTTTAIDFGNDRTSANCQAWARWVQEQTKKAEIDLVLISARTYLEPVDAGGKSRDQAFRDGYAAYLEGWRQAGMDVTVLRDTPVPGENVPDCVAQHRDDRDACVGTPDTWLPPDPLAEAAKAMPGRSTSVMDLSRYFCTEVCPPVSGGVLVYRDHSHISGTYINTMTPYLEPELLKELRRATR